MRSESKDTNAFTLIEMMVVISIIGVLASITLAALNGVKDKAKNVYINSTAEQYRLAIEMFRTTNNYLPGETNNIRACIGAGYPDHKCGYTSGELNGGIDNSSYSLEINSILAPYIDTSRALFTDKISVPNYSDCPQLYFDSGLPCPEPPPGPKGDFIGFMYSCIQSVGGKCASASLTWANYGRYNTCGLNNTFRRISGNNSICTLDIRDSN